MQEDSDHDGDKRRLTRVPCWGPDTTGACTMDCVPSTSMIDAFRKILRVFRAQKRIKQIAIEVILSVPVPLAPSFPVPRLPSSLAPVSLSLSLSPELVLRWDSCTQRRWRWGSKCSSSHTLVRGTLGPYGDAMGMWGCHWHRSCPVCPAVCSLGTPAGNTLIGTPSAHCLPFPSSPPPTLVFPRH